MTEYQRLYERLYRLVMGRGVAEPEPPECDELRRRMDRLPGSSDDKQAWGQAIGWRLYAADVYKG